VSEREAPPLPLSRLPLLLRAIGRRLLEVERLIAVEPDWFASEYGDPERFLTAASGPTQLTFSGGVVHALSSWPSQLSIVVEDAPFEQDPYAESYLLSETEHAPQWLRDCLGQRVEDVRVHRYRDDVPSDEARQAAISYQLEAGVELFYGTFIHGRLSGDELLRGDELARDHIAETVSIKERWWKS
jgi:hypothetical protein